MSRAQCIVCGGKSRGDPARRTASPQTAGRQRLPTISLSADYLNNIIFPDLTPSSPRAVPALSA